MIPRRRWQAALAAILIASGGCGPDGPTPPGAGDLTLSLTTPNTSDGALLLHITGGPVTSVSGRGSLVVVGSQTASGYRVVVTGPLTNGDFATIHVPDVTQNSRYLVLVEQVADGTTFALLDPVQHRVAVHR